MKAKAVFAVIAIGLALSGVAFAVQAIVPVQQPAAGPDDPRRSAPLVRVAEARPAPDGRSSFTGIVAARVQSDLGFRVPGKIEERFVDVGQRVTAGQPLMRLDGTDLDLTLEARRSAVTAARALRAQARADADRYESLADDSRIATRQRLEQAIATRDTTEAQLRAVEAEARVAQNQAAYSVLVADADGIVVETMAEPGQIVAVGQTVARIARSGPREAIVALPETLRPAIGSAAQAQVFAAGAETHPAQLRQLSDSADPRTRTYEARYVLSGAAADAPLGATVTILIPGEDQGDRMQIPLGALLDDGQRTGVWIIDRAAARVSFRTVALHGLTGEHALVTGLDEGEAIVALGAHLLRDGLSVRPESATGGQ